MRRKYFQKTKHQGNIPKTTVEKQAVFCKKNYQSKNSFQERETGRLWWEKVQGYEVWQEGSIINSQKMNQVFLKSESYCQPQIEHTPRMYPTV